jgi:hypothetical protein
MGAVPTTVTAGRLAGHGAVATGVNGEGVRI